MEFRSDDNNAIVRGYGAVFNSSTDLGPFTEEIRSSAFDNVLEGQDVVFVFQHNPSNMLARSSSGTLKYGVDHKGLWYEAVLPDTTLGNDMRALLERGDISANSFSFRDVTDTVKRINGKLHRSITNIGKLVDISLVTHPAYKDAVVTRSFPEQQEPITKKSELLKRIKY